MQDPRVTKRDFELPSDVVLDACCEPDCCIPILIDKELKENGRKTRCTACFTRIKLQK